jgi:hypothetical protein
VVPRDVAEARADSPDLATSSHARAPAGPSNPWRVVGVDDPALGHTTRAYESHAPECGPHADGWPLSQEAREPELEAARSTASSGEPKCPTEGDRATAEALLHHRHGDDGLPTPGPRPGSPVRITHSSDLLDSGLAAGLAVGRRFTLLPRR